MDHSQSPASSQASDDSVRQPSLEDLVAHLVASKRSLSAASHVQRAHDIVQAAREALEESATLEASNTFVRRLLAEQARTLDAVRHGVEQVGAEVHNEFTDLLHSLDETDAQLQSTVALLRNTPVEPSLQPSPAPSQSPGSSASSGQIPHTSKHLYDFVDDAALTTLHATLRTCIDQYNAARTTLVGVADTLDAQLSDLHAAVSSAHYRSPSVLSSSSRSLSNSGDMQARQHLSEQRLLPSIFRALESHATEAADLLQSLVRHYDLCVTALKHTEGGGQVVASELGLGAGDEGAEAILQHNDGQPEAPQPPLTYEERVDMMAVLEKDAGEVEDVVNEIRERLLEMETQLSAMQEATESRRVHRAKLMEAARLVHTLVPPVSASGEEENVTVGANVVVAAAAAFTAAWGEERERILQARTELQGLADFYEGFAAAYDDLLVEVSRRSEAQRKMEKVAREASNKLNKMIKEELQARDTFRAEQGEYLPSDIWPGLVDIPPHYEIRTVENPAAVPKIPHEVLDATLQRIQERG